MNPAGLSTSPPSAAPVRARWAVPLASLALALAMLLLAWRDTAVAMALIWWRSETFAHAMLVVPISLWLSWRLRFRLAGVAPGLAPLWLLPLAAAAALWLAGELVAANAVTQFALVLAAVSGIALLIGGPASRVLRFPLLFLFFCVPVGEALQPMLMEQTADFTIAALRLSGIPVYREGLHFVIPSGRWSVVEACSGLRYLIASVMVGSLFAYLNYRTPWRRWAFVGFSVLVPIVANWVRAYLIVMVGHLSGNELATGADHLVYGWVFFGIVIFIMFSIGARWSEPDGLERQMPVQGVPGPLSGASQARRWGLAAAAAALALVPVAGIEALDRQRASAPVALSLPRPVALPALTPPLADWLPRVENPAAREQRHFLVDGQAVLLDVAYFRAQGYGSKLVSSQHMLAPTEEKTWHVLESRLREARRADGSPLAVRASRIAATARDGGPVVTVWQFYWVDDELTPSDVRAKLYGARGRLSGQGDDAALVHIAAAASSPAASDAALQAFVAGHLGALIEQLRATRERR
jgi:exosortase A